MTATLLTAALELATLGWPVLPCQPQGKEPLTMHGVKDASTEPKTVRAWWKLWPEANLGVACGAPGPTVLDIDRPKDAQGVLRLLERHHPPTVATARGRHLYYAGTTNTTVSVGYGELRGQGSYVIAPPSIHPSGKDYVWLEAPHGPLPTVPELLAKDTRPAAGTGDWAAPTSLIAHGARHDALKDAAIRFLRAGVTDLTGLETMLRIWFETYCDPNPKPRRGEFHKLAEWAVRTDIAARERQPPLDLHAPKKVKKAKKPSVLEQPPNGDAPLTDHRAYVKLAAGLPTRVDIDQVRRHGRRPADELDIHLTNGQTIHFARQEQITTRGWWVRTIAGQTDGIADPQTIGDWEAGKVYRSLCILAGVPASERTEADDVRDLVDDLLAAAEALTGHDLSTPAGRYDVIARCRARPAWDPRRHTDEHQPVVIIDQQTQRYLRAGEVRDWFNARGFTLGAGAVPGRMRMINAEHLTLDGREPEALDGRRRRTNRMLVYRLAPDGS